MVHVDKQRQGEINMAACVRLSSLEHLMGTPKGWGGGVLDESTWLLTGRI